MNDYLRRRALIFAFALTIMVGGVMIAAKKQPAHADVITCTGFQGAVCEHLYDLSGDDTNWCEPLEHNGNLSSGTYTVNCLRSWVFWGTGDNNRYSLHNVEITANADPGYWAKWDQLATYSGPDYSSDGANSSTQVRIWSINIRVNPTTGNCPSGAHYPCDQRYYPSLSMASSGQVCTPSGGSITYGLSGPIGKSTFSWSQTDALQSSCMVQPGADVWSGYLNYTLQDSTYSEGRRTTDFTIGFQMPNNYNNSKIDIGYSNVTRYTDCERAVPWNFPTCFNHTMGSGNWSNNYIYGTSQNP